MIKLRQKDYAKRRNALRKKYETMERCNDVLYEERLDGRITVAKYDELSEKVAQGANSIDDELVKLEQYSNGAEITASNLLRLTANADELFENSKLTVKNQVL